MNSQIGMTTAKRHRLFVVLLDSLWRERQGGPSNKVIEMHISEQTAHLAAEFAESYHLINLRALKQRLKILYRLQGKDFLRSVISYLQSWVEEFRLGPSQQPHPYQRPISKVSVLIMIVSSELLSMSTSRENKERTITDFEFTDRPLPNLDKWDFPFSPPEWPLTRAERIAELQEQLPFYAKANQSPNILAAIAYHSQFPGEEMVTTDLITSSKANYWTLTRQVIIMG